MHRYALRCFALLAFFGFSAPAAAVVQEVRFYADTDLVTSTGCLSPEPGLSGAELRLSVTVDTAPDGNNATVLSAVLEQCVGSTNFGNPISVSPTTVQVNAGLDGFDSVASIVPGTALPSGVDVIRLAVATTQGGAVLDTLVTVDGGDPILLQILAALAVPTASAWVLIFLVLALIVVGATRLHRRRGPVTLIMLVLLLGASGAWAVATLGTGNLLAENPFANNDSDGEIRALYGSAPFSVHLRADVSLVSNQAPTANPQSASVNEDASVNISLSGSDPEAATLSFAIAGNPASGTLSGFNANTGAVTYTPSADFNGSDSFTFTVNDGLTTSGPATVSISVAATNDIPVANAQSASTGEDTAVVITLSGSDLDGDSLTFASASNPASGTLSGFNANTGTVTYTPNTNFNGTDSFTFTVNDGTATSAAATVSITVGAANDAPLANAQVVVTTEDTPTAITLSGSDADGDPLTFALAGNPANGVLSGFDANAGTVLYTPAANFNGSDSFSFTVSDGSATSAAATVSITVGPSNDAPVANAQSVATNEDAPAAITLTGTDLDGDPLTFAVVANPANGVLSGLDVNTGAVTYTPNADFSGADSFTFTVNDGSATSAAATVSITVNASNDPALTDLDGNVAGVDFAFAYTENAGPMPLLDTTDATITDVDSTTLVSVSITLTNLLDVGEETLAADATGFPNISVEAYDASTPGQGILVLSTTTPQPIADFVTVLRTATYAHTGDDPNLSNRSIVVSADDGNGNGPAATSTVTITALDDAPSANAQAVTTDEELAAVIALNGSDPEGGTLTFAIATNPANGTLSGLDTNTGAVTYTPNANFTGADGFTFTVNDGSTASAPATVSITVDPINDTPSANAQSLTTDEDLAAIITLTGTDVDADPLTFAIASNPSNGTLTGFDANTGAVTYTPNANFDGADSFTFTVSDGTSTSAAATVSITVNQLDDPPLANAQALATNEDTAAPITLTGSDQEGDPLTFAIAANPTNGTLSGFDANTGAVTYTPNADFNGADGFTFTVNDGTTTSPPATVSMTVNALNDAPNADAQSVTTDEDLSVPITLTGSDVDLDTLTFALATNPANGTLSGFNPATGAVTYTPNANFSGADSFTFTTNDGTVNSAAATVTITVNPINDPPSAVADAASIVEEAPNVAAANSVLGNVLGNDTDVDSVLNVSAVTGGTVGTALAGTYGAVTINADGSYTYALDDANPAVDALLPGGILTDVFNYTASDGTLTASAVLAVTINGADDPATPDNDAFDIIGNTELLVDRAATATPHALEVTGTGTGVLEGDVDPDGGSAITVSGIVGCGDVTTPFDCTIAGQGSVSLDDDGSFSFVPEAGDTDPTAAFQYTLLGNVASAGTVTLTRQGRVWYVDNDTPTPGNAGTSVDPFDTLVEAGTASFANDIIFVEFGDGTATGQSAGISLKDGQRLLGEHVGLSVPVNLNGNGTPTLLFAAVPGNRPVLADTVAGADGVSAVDTIPAEVAGLSLSGNVSALEWTTATAFAGSGAFSIHDNVVTGATGNGVDIVLDGTGATQLAFRNNNLTAGSIALNVLETGTGALVITAFDNNVVSGSSAADGIVVTNAIFDAVAGGALNTVDGGTTIIGTTADGVGGTGMALGSVQGDLHFTGDLQIFSDSGLGLSVSGAGVGFQLRVNAGGGPTGTIEANGGAAVVANAVGLDLRLSSLMSANSGGFGVSLTNVTGTFSAETGSAINNASATDFAISGGSANVSYKGTISDDVGFLVGITNTTAGSKNFSGAITDGNDGDGAGITLTNNSGAIINFSGGLTLSTGGNPAFMATGGGTVTMTDPAIGDNTLATGGGTALNVSNTTIGASGITVRSINSSGSSGGNVAIILANTAAGPVTVTGSGAAGSGGTISNKSVDAMTMNNTDGPVSLSSMIFEDIGDMADTVDNITGDDGIEGRDVDGGLALHDVTIRRVSDNAIHGAVTSAGADVATVWNGLTLDNVTIEDSNRFHIPNEGDDNNESMVRILGIRGTVSVTDSTLQRGAELLDFFVTGGALDMTATNNDFHYAYREFTSGPIASTGNHCIDVTVRNDADASVVIGDRTNNALDNDFLNCAIGSIRVVTDSNASGDIDVLIGQNEFTVDDHNSPLGADFFFPMGGVLVGSLGTDTATYHVIIDNNYFDEVTNASGGVGQFTLAMQDGNWDVLVEDNTFDTPGNAPWFIRADSTLSARVLFQNNMGIKGAFCSTDPSANGGGCNLGAGQLCPGAAGYCGPGLRSLADLQNGANLDLTIVGDTFAEHDAGFDPGQTFEARVLPTGGGGNICLDLQNNNAPDGYSVEEFAGDFDLVGAGTCPVGSPSGACSALLAARGNRGGANNPNTNPPFVNVEVGASIDVVAGTCQLPTF